MEIIPMTTFYNSTLIMDPGKKLVSCSKADMTMELVWSILKMSSNIVNNFITSVSYNI